MKTTAVATATLALVAAVASCGHGASTVSGGRSGRPGTSASSQPREASSAGPQGKQCTSGAKPPRITWTRVPLRNARTPKPVQVNQFLSLNLETYAALRVRSADPVPVRISQAFPRRPGPELASCG